MRWNWQHSDWPHFSWNSKALSDLESEFSQKSGLLLGTTKHLNTEDKEELTIHLMTDEAVKTSEIEGEYLNRDSVQSSLRKNFGLTTARVNIPPRESGIASLLTDLYLHFDQPLTHRLLYTWHQMVMQGSYGLHDVGQYRQHEAPMQVISGPIHQPKVHFEAPPSLDVEHEMERFINWFNKSDIPALTFAGLTHLYFVSIHPFEDGNGRIGRALAEKALSIRLGHPTLIALSQMIQRKRKKYYEALERNNRRLEITDWLVYFAETVLEAQAYSQSLFDFLISKTKLFERLRGALNPRQHKCLERMFREGPEGFKGGLSAENYISITGTSRATATRDLHDLVVKKALLKTGELKATRYILNLADR